MSVAAKVQVPKNVGAAAAGGQLEAVLDDGTKIYVPTVASGYITEGVSIPSAYPLKMVVTDDASPPGAATLTGPCGRVAIAAGASSVVITRAGTTTATKCFAQKLNLDSVLVDFKVVCTTNTITITGNGNANADCYFDYFVVEAA